MKAKNMARTAQTEMTSDEFHSAGKTASRAFRLAPVLRLPDAPVRAVFRARLSSDILQFKINVRNRRAFRLAPVLRRRIVLIRKC